MRRFLVSLACFLAALFVGPGWAELGPGDTVPSLSLNDQHDRDRTLTEETRVLLFAPDRAAGDIVTEALQGQDEESLAAKKIQYVADISGMPGIITSLFALPKLRERPYPILLGEEAEQTESLPRRADHVTLMRFARGQVAEVRYLDSATALRDAIGLSAEQE